MIGQTKAAKGSPLDGLCTSRVARSSWAVPGTSLGAHISAPQCSQEISVRGGRLKHRGCGEALSS